MGLCILMSRGPWERGHAKFGAHAVQSSPKPMPCKARQSPPFMILAEAKEKQQQQQQQQSMSSST